MISETGVEVRDRRSTKETVLPAGEWVYARVGVVGEEAVRHGRGGGRGPRRSRQEGGRVAFGVPDPHRHRVRPGELRGHLGHPVSLPPSLTCREHLRNRDRTGFQVLKREPSGVTKCQVVRRVSNPVPTFVTAESPVTGSGGRWGLVTPEVRGGVVDIVGVTLSSSTGP